MSAIRRFARRARRAFWAGGGNYSAFVLGYQKALDDVQFGRVTPSTEEAHRLAAREAFDDFVLGDASAAQNQPEHTPGEHGRVG